MELFIFVLIVGGIVGAFYHPATKNSPFISQLRKILKGWLTVETVKPVVPEPEDDDVEVISKESEPGNVPRIKEETGKEPSTKKIHAFPKMRKPVTRFEEFNAKLFIYSPSENRRWDKSIDNDFATTIKGEQSWLKEELKRRLRPQYPVLFDPFGWWAKASSELELDPHFDDPTVSAYLKFPRDKRPVVVSQLHKDNEEESDTKFTLYRYGFVDYAFERKFLADYPADLIHGLLKAFSGSDSAWESFSPARLRKDVLEANREEEDHRQVMASYQHANRFAALWNLREEKPKKSEEEKQEDDEL